MRNLGLSIAFAALAFAASYLWQSSTGISDIYQRLCIVRAWLSGAPPYSACLEHNPAQPAEYPLTTILLLIPLSGLPDRTAAALFWAVSNGLLFYGILRRGDLRYLLIFTSGVYWSAFIWQQFSILITAVVFLPVLLPLALIKPQIGLPVILTNLTRWRFLACAAFVALTFIIYPGWIPAWYARSGSYNGAVPLLAFPPLVLLLLKYRDKNAWLLLLMACMPQRTLMDTLAAFTAPQTARRLAVLCLLSWMPAAWFFAHPAMVNPGEAMPWTIVFVYAPAALFLFL